MFTSYNQDVSTAIETANDASEIDNVASVRYKVDGEKFFIEYLNDNDGSDNYLNVCGLDDEDHAERVAQFAEANGMAVDSVTYANTVVVTDAEDPRAVSDEMDELVMVAAGGEGQHWTRGATTKHAPDSAREALSAMVAEWKERLGLTS